MNFNKKQKLSKKYGFPIEMTETEMAKNLDMTEYGTGGIKICVEECLRQVLENIYSTI